VTARGSPSGTATTIIVTPRINAFKSPLSDAIVNTFSLFIESFISPRIIRAKKVSTATPTPNNPIYVEIRSNLAYRGVNSSSVFKSASVLPICVNGPTAITIALPFPVSISELFSTNGHGIWL